MIALAAGFCAAICLLASRAFGVPPVEGLDISLLNGGQPILSILVIAVTFIGGATLVSLAVGRWSHEAGLFAAAVGLAVFAVRGGSISTTLRYSSGAGVYMLLAIELVLMYAMVVAAIWLSHRWSKAAPLAQTEANDEQPSRTHHLFAVGVQAVTMAIIMLAVGQSESKKQAMATVMLAAYAGSIAAHYTFPILRGHWLAFGPLLVGIVGYFLEGSKPTLLPIGLVDQPMAIALPIELVSAGIIGGILGHWMSQKWADEAAGQTLPPLPAKITTAP
jgi:hypothetical protein